MEIKSHLMRRAGKAVLFGLLFVAARLHAQIPIVSQTNVTIRVMAANLTSGNGQSYETPGINIFQGLKPDIVTIQEFRYNSSHDSNDLRILVNAAFGTNFYFYCEPSGNIPNGIISRYPITTNSSWDDGDANITDRGFAWARIHLPGTNDLYAVSVHLKASSGSAEETRRSNQVVVLKTQIKATFPTNAWIIVAGDMNLYSDTEPAITNLTAFLSDKPIPTDQKGGTNTNAGRNERYDRVLVSFALTNSLVPVVIGGNTFTNGLVFVSTNYTPLTDVAPVQYLDSYALSMQHMGVVKDFKISYLVTNLVIVPPPVLTLKSTNIIRWSGVSNLTYTVQSKTNLISTNWLTLGTATSTTTNLSFTNSSSGTPQRFYRVTYP